MHYMSAPLYVPRCNETETTFDLARGSGCGRFPSCKATSRVWYQCDTFCCRWDRELEMRSMQYGKSTHSFSVHKVQRTFVRYLDLIVWTGSCLYCVAIYRLRVRVRDELKRLAVDVFEPTLRRLQAMEQNNAGAGVDGMAAAPSSPAIPVGGNRSDSVAFYGGSFWSR